MIVEKTPLAGVLLIKPQIFSDSRGFFVETWQAERYAAHGIVGPFVQDNHSCSTQGVLRGLHFQISFPQGKLVSVSLGSVFDVVVDIRPQSSTRGQWFGATLTAENQHQLWVPPGMAHGYCVNSNVAHFHYKCTDFYHQNDEGSLLWNDSKLNITWPISKPTLSTKDAQAPTWLQTFGK